MFKKIVVFNGDLIQIRNSFFILYLHIYTDLEVFFILVDRGLIDLTVIILPKGAKPCLTYKGIWFWQKLGREALGQ